MPLSQPRLHGTDPKRKLGRSTVNFVVKYGDGDADHVLKLTNYSALSVAGEGAWYLIV